MSEVVVPAVLVVGASRGLGLVAVAEFARRGWRVTATTRGPSDDLDAVARAHPGLVEIERLELTSDAELDALADRLAGRRLDIVLVNAAVNRGNAGIDQVSTESFTAVMITNALRPLRVIERLRELVPRGGTLAVMSSEQGSIALNTEPGFELYKSSKAALNQLVRSYATRRRDDGHAVLLLDPGHNRTRLGGPDAPLLPTESVPALVGVLAGWSGGPGVFFVDRFGAAVPW